MNKNNKKEIEYLEGYKEKVWDEYVNIRMIAMDLEDTAKHLIRKIEHDYQKLIDDVNDMLDNRINKLKE